MESQEEALCVEVVGRSGDLGGTLSYCGAPESAWMHHDHDNQPNGVHPFKPAPLPSPASTPAPTEETTMDEFKQYRRTQVAEMADWHPGFDMDRVSVSAPDAEAGSPKAGDKIARNPANHDDRWLVAADYFAANFEPAR